MCVTMWAALRTEGPSEKVLRQEECFEECVMYPARHMVMKRGHYKDL
jgi:hypothetical protein